MPQPEIACPKCGNPMRQLRVGESFIDRCESCFGIFLDADDRLMAVNRKLVDVLDIAPASYAAEHDRVHDIDCPRCNEKMQHRMHPDQKHIGFEECPGCQGRYFDAGELRDLSQLTLSDVLRNLLR